MILKQKKYLKKHLHVIKIPFVFNYSFFLLQVDEKLEQLLFFEAENALDEFLDYIFFLLRIYDRRNFTCG